MFGGKNKNSRRPIGVAVTPSGVRLAQVSPTVDGYALSAAAFAPLPPVTKPGTTHDSKTLGHAITTALKQADFTGKQSVSAMPAQSMRYKNIRLPKMPESELAQAVEWEAKERIALGEPASVQFYNAGEVRQGQDKRCEVVLLAAKQSAIQAHVQALTQAGLEPIAIDATGGALARLSAPTGDVTFTVNLEPRHVEVVIASQGRVLLNKLLPVGEGDLASADLPELAREIGLCLRYHTVTFRGEKPEQILLAGEPAPQALLDAMSAALGLPSATFDQAGILTPAPSLRAQPPLNPWAIAAGLSLRGHAVQTQRGAA
ncbi:MAG: type IV pilus biogenesis protein PilM [Phycisphaerales bacterium JB063]